MHNINKKIGRPTNEPKNNVLQIRTSDEFTRKLDFCCEHTNMTKADVIRLGVEKVYEELKK